MNKKLIGLLLCLPLMLGVTGCDDKMTSEEIQQSESAENVNTYNVAKKSFYYSVDNGKTYGNERYELEIGQTILMKLIINIESTKTDRESIGVSLGIPMIRALDAYQIRGQHITPRYDEVNEMTYYDFNIITNDKDDWVTIFEFIPLKPCICTMSLDFDSPIPSQYNTINSIKFVEAKNTSSEETTSESTVEE